MNSHNISPLRVFHFITALDFSGAPKGVLELVRRQVEDETIEPYLCVLASEDESIELPKFLPHPQYLCSYLSAKRPAQAYRDCRKLRQMLLEKRIDIIHSHLLSADFIAAAAVAGTNIVHVSHIRGTLPWLKSPKFRNILKKIAYKYFFRKAKTKFIAVSEDAAQHTHEALKIEKGAIRTILNGIDVGKFHPYARRRIDSNADAPIVIGCAGRFSPEKGHELVIRSVAHRMLDDYNIQLRIAGSGSLHENYINLANKLQIGYRLNLPGIVQDMNEFYNSIDIFVLPSLHSEGLARVMLEACAAECCIIATDTAGVREVISDGSNGFILPPDDAEALARKLLELCNNREQIAKIGSEARKNILAKFTADRVSENVKNYYSDIRHESYGRD